MTKYNFEFTNKFKKQIYKLDKSTGKQIKLTIDKFILNPDSCDWKKLKGHESFYRIRSGDYRIIFEKQDFENESIVKVLFLEVKHRREVYKDL